jgi:diguanylate cyclase (GGDEF)-like protein/PAS domain S-box-containing protein
VLQYAADGSYGAGVMSRNVLLIQSDSADTNTVLDALTNSHDAAFLVECLGLCTAGLKRLADDCGTHNRDSDAIAAVLLDLFLPDSAGIQTFDRVFRAAPHIPILILCASAHEDIARAAVQRGAQDYLLKHRLDAYLLPKALHSMIERAAIAEALFEEKERALVTLNSIGDAVMSSDLMGNVTYLNAVAEEMTGWSRQEALGHPVEEVFHIIDAATREVCPNPMALARRNDQTVCLTPNSILVRRDGIEAAIEDSAAPIHDRRGRVTGAVMVFHDVSATRALSIRMSYLAQHDSLTDVPNRVVFNDRLTQAITMAHRHREKLAVLFLDLDRFKHINDTLGHNIGDRLLQSVARRLRSCVRGSDTVSRRGGDEFVILLAEVTHAQDAALCAEKVLLALSAPHRVDQRNLHLTASIGIVTYPDDGTDAETLLRHADFAMYHAKQHGRTNYQFFESDMTLRALERQSLEDGLRHALERRQLVLYYQPIVNLRTRAIVGAEALIRWRHPQRGLILPAQFMPIAEESGFVLSIGRWALGAACRQLRIWQHAGVPAMRIAINISAAELHDKAFVAGVRTVLAETGVAPRHLELELTETLLMQDAAATAAVLHALREVGVKLALDDFGTGYSSLSRLKHLPIDTLKIDQAFVRDIASSASDAVIVGLVIGMGRSLNMRVVAEGVETSEDLAALLEHGCAEGQGHYFGKATAAGEFPHLQPHARPTVPPSSPYAAGGGAESVAAASGKA